MHEKKTKLNILDTWQSELIQLVFEWEAFNSIDLYVYSTHILSSEPTCYVRLRINQAIASLKIGIIVIDR